MANPTETLMVDSVVLTTSTSSSTFEPVETTLEPEKQEAMDENHDRMGQRFKRTIDQELGISNHYTHVAVRIIHWAQEFDTDLDCWKEAQDLNKLFCEDFKFDSEIVTLNTKTKPQLQLNKEIANFVHDNNGPEHSHLLIVYYTGHGFTYNERPHTLIISGTEAGDRKGDERYAPNANWKVATRSLEDAEADTLVILDCCNAGNIMKGATQQTRAYEIMTAAGKDTPTESPGKESYTTALMESLRELRRQGTPFTTWQLHQMIYKQRNYNTASLFWNYGFRGPSRHIYLAPPVQHEPDRVGPAAQRAGHLDICIAFEDNSNLTDDQVETLARELSKIRRAARLANLNICDIQWNGFTSREHPVHRKHSFKVLGTVMGAANHFKNRKRRQTEDEAVTHVRSPKRPRHSEASKILDSHPTIVQAMETPLTPCTDNCESTPPS